jgi:Na+/proline symporter
MASCKNERHAVWATLWFQVAHYCLRPWPWLLIGFAALAMYPDLRGMEDPGLGFPMVIRDVAPEGLRGLMLVVFAAAFMSTISTQMNWGASYLVNDFYKPFIRPNADHRHLTRVSRLASLFVLLMGGSAAWLMKGISVDQAWKLLTALGAGTGAVYMLRWFWWRINAWSEISAMVASLAAFLIVRNFVETPEYQLAVIAGLTIPTWVVVTLVTPAERPEILLAFYRKVQPAGPGWGPTAQQAPDVRRTDRLGVSVLLALLASGMVYLTLPGVGLLIFGRTMQALLCLVGAVACGLLVALLMRCTGQEDHAG